LQDLSITIPLLELGVMPAGSHGRTATDGTPFIRASKVLTGVDFDNSDIAFLGNFPADVEAVAAIEPDLIISFPGQSEVLEQLERIAPTIVLDSNRRGFEVYEVLAEITGTAAQRALLEVRYAEQIDQIRRVIDTEQITVNHIVASQGAFRAWHTYQTLGKVLRDAGFGFPESTEAIAEGTFADFSPEALQELDADYIFVSYRVDTLETPADAAAQLESVLPRFCDFLEACRSGRLIFIPREEAATLSYDALSIIAYTVLTQIGSHEVATASQ
jgi:iron complex transport system substrate-binding protein